MSVMRTRLQCAPMITKGIDVGLQFDPKATCSGNYTMGGYPEVDASHWNADSYQKLGNFIHRMTSGTIASRKKAYLEIIYMRNRFMRDEWNDYINKLDAYRASLGACPISEYFDAMRDAFIHDTVPADLPEVEREPVICPEEKSIKNCKPVVKSKEIVVEQLSLF